MQARLHLNLGLIFEQQNKPELATDSLIKVCIVYQLFLFVSFLITIFHKHYSQDNQVFNAIIFECSLQ